MAKQLRIVANTEDVRALGEFQLIDKRLLEVGRGQWDQLAKNLIRNSRDKFESRIKRPETSATRGGQIYGRGGKRNRQTGKFKFGKDRTFHTSYSEVQSTKRIALSWPDVVDADRRTKKIWRVLEEGLPKAKHRMGPHIWLTPGPYGAKPSPEAIARYRVPAERGRQDLYHPVGRAKPRRGYGFKDRAGTGFEGKFFLRDAWDEEVPRWEVNMKKKLGDAFEGFRR